MKHSNNKFIYYLGFESLFNFPILCGLFFFFIYWLSPLFINSITLVFNNQQIDITHFVNSYVNDSVHLIFSVIVSVGAIFAAKICGIINDNKDKLSCKKECAEKSDKLKQHYLEMSNGYLIKIFSLIICVLTAFIVTIIAIEQLNWWGVTNGAINSSGMMFIINTSAMVFFGVNIFIQISLRSLLTSILAGRFIDIDFFHSDGCNGQKEVGNLIMYGWVLSIFCVSSIFILYQMGYMGIEKSAIAAIISIVLILSVPMISILPLWAIVKAVSREKNYAIININKRSKISTYFKPMRKYKKKKNNYWEESTLNTSEYLSIRNYLEKANVWPFNFKAILFATIAYLIQSILVLDKLIVVVNKWI
jgi:hypothetical protein